MWDVSISKQDLKCIVIVCTEQIALSDRKAQSECFRESNSSMPTSKSWDHDTSACIVFAVLFWVLKQAL